MAFGAPALVHEEEVNRMSCDVPGCRKGGCTTPKPSEK